MQSIQKCPFVNTFSYLLPFCDIFVEANQSWAVVKVVKTFIQGTIAIGD